jgi:hypothetical protein
LLSDKYVVYFAITYAHPIETETEKFTSIAATWKSIDPLVSDISGYHCGVPLDCHSS